MMFRGLSLLLMVLFSLSANAAEIKVTSDRDPVALDESFTLTFETEEKVDGDPDFTPLERDFQIRTRSKSSSIQWVNGRKTSKESWILTVMARKKGTLTVPPIRFGDDISTILKINVTNTVQPQKKGGDAAIFLEVSADRESVYLQAQLLYTVRFYTAKRIMDYTLSEPTFSTGSAIIKKLGDDYQFETMRGGHRYVVVERRYAIFPQTTGKLELEPILFEGQILTGRQSTLQLFNQQLQIKRVRSEGISVDVKPIPASFSGKEWFPANRVTFDSEWLSKEFRVGEPVTRKLKIEAVGVDAKLIPVLSKDRKVSGIKIYPDQPQLEDSIGSGGLIGSRLESIAVIPTKEGKLVLPEIKL
ncbi:MAG: BatD family protein, partial [Gammaproteobacteria bacterium]|nr:BatD family protein [Gammaproteobacteria bacterium]